MGSRLCPAPFFFWGTYERGQPMEHKTKYRQLTEAYLHALGVITESPATWAAFLCSAAYTYEERFQSQVLLHHQRPGIKAVATLNQWDREKTGILFVARTESLFLMQNIQNVLRMSLTIKTRRGAAPPVSSRGPYTKANRGLRGTTCLGVVEKKPGQLCAY